MEKKSFWHQLIGHDEAKSWGTFLKALKTNDFGAAARNAQEEGRTEAC